MENYTNVMSHELSYLTQHQIVSLFSCCVNVMEKGSKGLQLL